MKYKIHIENVFQFHNKATMLGFAKFNNFMGCLTKDIEDTYNKHKGSNVFMLRMRTPINAGWSVSTYTYYVVEDWQFYEMYEIII